MVKETSSEWIYTVPDKTGKTALFIENISTNVYSLEELCYYLYHNLYLIDRTIMNEELCSWIQEELALPGLAAKLRPALGKFASVEDIVYPVFKEINYLTYEELKELNAGCADWTKKVLYSGKNKRRCTNRKRYVCTCDTGIPDSPGKRRSGGNQRGYDRIQYTTTWAALTATFSRWKRHWSTFERHTREARAGRLWRLI